MRKTVIFDLDGTLADTSGDLIAAANACFRGLGQGEQLDPKRDMSTAFKGGRAMLRLGFERLGSEDIDQRIEEEFPKLLTHYERDIDRYTRIYDGVERCLDHLRDQGVNLGICTNKPEGLAEKLLQNLGLRSRFAALIGADSLAERKPHPLPLLETIRRVDGRPDKAILVGDTVTDRDAAKNASVLSVLVTFGPDGRSVADLKPEALLDHYDQLPEMVDRLLAS